MSAYLELSEVRKEKKIRKGITIKIFLLCAIIFPLFLNAQITFDKSENELIKIGKNAFVREISTDSLFVIWKIFDLKATGSDNVFMAYERETHSVEFKATYDDLENLSSWVKERQNTKTGGAVTLGEWEVSYVQSALGIPIFMWTGPTGNFEAGISSDMRLKLMTRKYIEGAIEKYFNRKKKEEKRNAKRKSKKQ